MPGPPSIIRCRTPRDRTGCVSSSDGVVGEHLQKPVRVVWAFCCKPANTVGFRDFASAHHHPQRLLRKTAPVAAAGIQGRVVRKGGAGSDHDRIGPVAHQVPINAGGGAGNPLAGAVSSSNKPIQGGSRFSRNKRAALGGGNKPALIQQVRAAENPSISCASTPLLRRCAAPPAAEVVSG